ncbi:MAG: hypothetical protein L0Z50_09350, partial [Verrucomicrobiales bacterium]|nr:hypothetical protein [Verrucomicrobiales bacterium]
QSRRNSRVAALARRVWKTVTVARHLREWARNGFQEHAFRRGLMEQQAELNLFVSAGSEGSHL